MGSFLTYIKSNAAGVVCLVLAAGLFVGCAMLNPPIAVPAALREHDKTIPAELPLSKAIPFLNDARASLERRSTAYAAEVKRDGEAIASMLENVEEEAAWVANAKALIWQGGTDALTAGASAIPGLNLILPGLIGIGGLLMDKPGAKKKIAKAEAKGYTVGFNERAVLDQTGKLPVELPAEVLKETQEDGA